MRIRITKETPICIDDVSDVVGYLHKGDEYDVFPTDDGLMFEALGKMISPYDILRSTELVV